jgi:hypothetical protein
VKKFIRRGYPLDTIKSIIKMTYEDAEEKDNLRYLGEDIVDALTLAYSDIFDDMTERDVDNFHSQIKRIVS